MIALLAIGACSSGADSADTPSATASNHTSANVSLNVTSADLGVDGNPEVLESANAHRCKIDCITDRVLLAYLRIIGGDSADTRYQIEDDEAVTVDGTDLLPNL